MSSNRIYKFRDITEMQHRLNGGVIGHQGDIFSGIVGKTFILALPSVKTVTFTASATPPNGDSTALRFLDVKAQIEAVATDVKVLHLGGCIAVIEDSISGGVTVNKTGTANATLGFDSAVNTVGKFYNPPPSAVVPCWTFAYCGSDNSHIAFTLE